MDPATVEWLEITGGAKYSDAFLKHGVRNMDDLVYMAFEEPHEFINSIGMKQLQASKFKDMLTNEQHPKSPRISIRKTRSLRLDGNVNRERVERILRPDDDDAQFTFNSPNALSPAADDEVKTPCFLKFFFYLSRLSLSLCTHARTHIHFCTQISHEYETIINIYI
jgi:hypothetical protein